MIGSNSFTNWTSERVQTKKKQTLYENRFSIPIPSVGGGQRKSTFLSPTYPGSVFLLQPADNTPSVLERPFGSLPMAWYHWSVVRRCLGLMVSKGEQRDEEICLSVHSDWSRTFICQFAVQTHVVKFKLNVIIAEKGRKRSETMNSWIFCIHKLRGHIKLTSKCYCTF